MQKTGTPNEYRRELKKKILAYVMGEFRKQGIRAVKMDNVAKALGISKRTVYEIYNDKEAILIDGLAMQSETARQTLQQVAASQANVIEMLAAFYEMNMEDVSAVNPVFYTDVEKYPKAVEFIRKMGEERDRLAVGFFERGIREGYFYDNIDYDIILQLAKHTSMSVMQNQLFNKYPLKQLLRNMLIVYLRGVCTAKGVELFDKLIKGE